MVSVQKIVWFYIGFYGIYHGAYLSTGRISDPYETKIKT
jgi:hypothetical protein